MSKKKKEVLIEVIETPRGAVPTAESIKSLVKAWNDILEIMNENLDKISQEFSKISKEIRELGILIRKLDTSLQLMSRELSSIKILLRMSLQEKTEITKESERKKKKFDEKEKAKEILRKMMKDEE